MMGDGFFSMLNSGYAILILALVQILLIFLLIRLYMNYRRLKESYRSFTRGKDGKSLEDSLTAYFEKTDKLQQSIDANAEAIRGLEKAEKECYQKTGIVRYDAFEGMTGKLSFALALLNDEDTGWILNVLQSQDGCYLYTKEVIKGKSYIELTQEEKEAMERAMFQEAYEIKSK